MRYDQHMTNDEIDHADIETLRDELRQTQQRLREKTAELTEAEALIPPLRAALEEQEELRTRWIDVFEMQLREDGTWVFDGNQSALWAKHAALHKEHADLVRQWNRFVGKYNEVVAPTSRGKGRPLAASEAQIEMVTKQRRQGASLRTIAASTGLSLTTVRTITADKPRREREHLKRKALNKEAAARYRARKRERDFLEHQINDVGRKTADLLKAASGIGR